MRDKTSKTLEISVDGVLTAGILYGGRLLALVIPDHVPNYVETIVLREADIKKGDVAIPREMAQRIFFN